MAADAYVLVVIGVALWWAMTRPVRIVPLVIGVVAGVVFTITRNHYRLQESPFVWALIAIGGGAVAATTGLVLLARRDLRSSFGYGALAGALVPMTFAAYLAVALTICAITNCDHS